MFTRLLLTMFTLTVGLLMMTGPVQADKYTAIYLAIDAALENTQRNVRDKDGTTLTPDDQKSNKKDINITTKIRKVLIKDKSLSVNAHNIKIITSNRIVTLRGIVENADESMTVEKVAKKTHGVIRIDNQLEIKSPIKT